MIFVEMQLSGKVSVYELTEHMLLLKVYIETRAACLPTPSASDAALDYLRSTCWGLEIFDSIEDADDWADDYSGFRAEEVRAELRRFIIRKGEAEGANMAA